MAEFGGKPVKYGIEWPRGTSRLTMELYCLRVDQRGDNVDGRLSSFDHYKNAVDIIFNGKDSVRKHVWSDESVKMATTFLGNREDKRFVGVAGNSSCVAGKTRLLDPVNGGGATIQEYCERGERPWVQTLNGPVLADVPYLKGRTELFEVRVANGGEFTCTGEHRLLTSSGWRFLKDLRVGDAISGYDGPSGSNTELTSIESIVSVGDGDFYDLNVPVEHHYYAEGALHHNSGKSDTLGLFCIIMYLSAPANTLCLLTSTTLEDAKGRVWKGVREYWTQVERFFGHSGRKVPGSPVHSKGRIRGLDGAGNYTDTTGLRLIAADRTKGDDATSKLMGIKAPGDGLLILGADELPDLSSSILTVAFTNLVNNPRFWMYGLGNPNLKLDAHGRFCEPKEGWDAVSHNPMEWDTERGKVIRFESEDSSRIREEDDWSEAQKKKKKTRFFWQPSRKTIEAAAKQWGRTSRAFLRMYSARWSSAKAPNAIYSESELMRAAVDEPAWDSVAEVVMVSGLDSSYTSGGDRSVCVDLMCGRVKGVKHAHIARIQNLMINDRSDVAPSHQIVRAWMKHCQQRGVRPKAAGFDNSGSGVSFGSIVEMEWSVEVKKINFGGQPSGRLYRLDGDTAMDFANRMSELWVQPKQFIRGYRTPDGEYVSQLTGLTPELIEEMVNRQYDDAGEGAKLKVEQKRKMRDRTGSSPDVADAFFIAIEVAIQNGWLDSQEEKKILKKVKGEWEEQRKRLKYKTRRGRNMTF